MEKTEEEIVENDLEESVDELTEDDLDEEEEDILEEEVIQPEEKAEKSPFGIWSRDTVTLKRLKVLLYGVSGVGKTSFAATFPSPLFLDLESGMMSTLRIGEVRRYPADWTEDITSFQQVRQFYALVSAAKNPPFQTIVIDSINELQVLVAQYVVDKYKKVTRQYDDLLTIADYQKSNNDLLKVVRAFLKLPYNIVFTATSTRLEPGDDYTMVTPKYKGKEVGPVIEKLMDLIGYCYAKPQKNGTAEHYASFHITDRYLAKDRLGIVSKDIPNNFNALIGSTERGTK